MNVSKNTIQNLIILVVEDDSFIATDLRYILLGLGCASVHTVDSVRDALSILQAEPIDAAILDVSLPDQRVRPVAAKLTEAAIPYAVFSAHPKELFAADKLLSMAPYLDKPFSHAQLEAILLNLAAGSAHRCC